MLFYSSSVMKNLAESQQKSQMHHMSGSGGLAEELVIMGTPLSSIAASASSSLSSSYPTKIACINLIKSLFASLY